jgi:hypothetical protein
MRSELVAVRPENGNLSQPEALSACIREGANWARASLTMGKPSSPVETLKITLSGAGGAKGKLLIEWENVTVSAPFTVK